METHRVNLGDNSYNIYIGENTLSKIGVYLKELVVGTRILLITNPTVNQLYGQLVEKSLQDAGFTIVTGLVPDGEEYKSMNSAQKLYDIAFDSRLDRKCAVVALGGGVVGDLAGFVAATYMRGLPFIQVPTTLLAQVDSSVGGKVAVNHPRGKNIIGAFYQPKMVFTDIATLQTLPKREFKAGMAEVIKYGVIKDKSFFDFLAENCSDIMGLKGPDIVKIIKTSCAIKAWVVEQDEKEENLRAILNYGHTFGHAYEALTGYRKYLHGEALTIGMISAAKLAEKMGLLAPGETSAIKNLIDKYELPKEFTNLDIEEIIGKMYHDKKVAAGKINFVLPETIGRVGIYNNVTENLIREALSCQK